MRAALVVPDKAEDIKSTNSVSPFAFAAEKISSKTAVLICEV